MAVARDVVAQQRRRLVHVHHDDVDVAVVVEIPEGAATARVRRGHAGSRFVDQLLEPAVTQIAEHQPGCPEGVGRKRLLHLGIDAAGRHEQVGEAVVVEIDHPRSPPDVAGLHADARADAEIVEVAFPVVAVQDIRIVGEVRLEDIQVCRRDRSRRPRCPCPPVPARLRSAPRRAPGPPRERCRRAGCGTASSAWNRTRRRCRASRRCRSPPPQRSWDTPPLPPPRRTGG